MPFQPNTAQREIARVFVHNARLLGTTVTIRRLFEEAGAKYDQPRIGELVAHVAARQSEYARAVIDAFRAGRFSAAMALTRSLLEMTVWLAWPFGVSVRDSDSPAEHDRLLIQRQKVRLIQLLLQDWRDARHRGISLPHDVRVLLAEATGTAARRPPSFNDMLQDLDRLERETEGGIPFWTSHAGAFEAGSDHVHATRYGSFKGLYPMEVDELLGVSALVYAHQYLALGAATCAIAADIPSLQTKVEQRYASVAELQKQELARLRGPTS